MTDQENIKKELLKQGIKLWKPPYYGVSGGDAAVVQLATTNFDTASAVNHLRDLQSHALEKLRSKGKLLDELSIKILGRGEHPQLSPSVLGLSEEEGNNESLQSRTITRSWAERIEQINNNTIKLHCVNPDLTVDNFAEQLAALLDAPTGIRLVYKGKSLAIDNHGARLVDVVAAAKSSILCLVHQSESLSTASLNRSSDEALIDSIRTAAAKLQSGAMLDITDSAGNLVSMTHADRLAFLTALGLHAIAKKKMQQQENLQSALVFLLQADQEWDRLNESWRDRVDNYGLLQLDICWVYLKFESIENLPDVVERLNRAEAALRKQVDRNFVTLALVQAEQDNPVPAVAAIFVRLFLLQGVAQHFQQNKIRSRERLDWAWGLAKSLRAVSPSHAVDCLCEAVGVTPFHAVSALRRSNGNIDQAAELIQKDEEDAAKASEQRYKQRKLGLCENGTDYVNLKLVEQLQTVLGLSADDESVTSGLLRLANNNFEGAIDMYQDAMRDKAKILRRVAELDQSQGVTSTHKKRRRDEPKIDEMALASLVSMGVDEECAKRALARNDNNVEMSLMWLTNQRDANENSMDVEAAATDSNQSPEQASANQDGAAVASAVTPRQEDRARSQPRAVSLSPRQIAEQEAIALLNQVLGQVLEEQNNEGCDCLGNSLDEEWKYIEQYRVE